MCLLLAGIILTRNQVMASGFNLKSIGSVETNGMVSHWWYTSPNPKLKGESLPTVAVDVSIDGETETVPTSSDGEWEYQSTKLTTGDHEVVLKSGDSTISFRLTIGTDTVDWDAVGKGSTKALPVAGSTETTIVLLASSLAMAAIGGKILLHANR